jgi:hypothetical protein
MSTVLGVLLILLGWLALVGSVGVAMWAVLTAQWAWLLLFLPLVGLAAWLDVVGQHMP